MPPFGAHSGSDSFGWQVFPTALFERAFEKMLLIKGYLLWSKSLGSSAAENISLLVGGGPIDS